MAVKCLEYRQGPKNPKNPNVDVLKQRQGPKTQKNQRLQTNAGSFNLLTRGFGFFGLPRREGERHHPQTHRAHRKSGFSKSWRTQRASPRDRASQTTKAMRCVAIRRQLAFVRDLLFCGFLGPCFGLGASTFGLIDEVGPCKFSRTASGTRFENARLLSVMLTFSTLNLQSAFTNTLLSARSCLATAGLATMCL